MEAQTLFWTEVAAVGQVAGALATFIAVVISLRLAVYERSAKLNVRAGLKIAISGDGSPPVKLVSVHVENIGSRMARVSSIGWRTGWFDSGPSWVKRQYAVQMLSDASPRTPYDLEPGKDVTFFVWDQELRREDRIEKNLSFFGRKLPWVEGLRPANIRASVFVVGAKPIYQRVERSLAEYLIQSLHETEPNDVPE